MVSYYLIFPVVRSFLVFSGFGLKSPASGFQFYSTSSLKTSPSLDLVRWENLGGVGGEGGGRGDRDGEHM